jgi:hypothetical protein
LVMNRMEKLTQRPDLTDAEQTWHEVKVSPDYLTDSVGFSAEW